MEQKMREAELIAVKLVKESDRRLDLLERDCVAPTGLPGQRECYFLRRVGGRGGRRAVGRNFPKATHFRVEMPLCALFVPPVTSGCDAGQKFYKGSWWKALEMLSIKDPECIFYLTLSKEHWLPSYLSLTTCIPPKLWNFSSLLSNGVSYPFQIFEQYNPGKLMWSINHAARVCMFHSTVLPEDAEQTSADRGCSGLSACFRMLPKSLPK